MGEETTSIKAVIFDMGGVLLRTEDAGPRTRLAEQYGLTRRQLEVLVFQSPTAIQAEEGKISEKDHWLAVAAELEMDPMELPGFFDQFWGGDRLDENLIRFIKNLKQSFKTGLLSNAWTGARDSIAERFPFFDAFDQVIFSSEVGMRKPAIAIFDLMLEKLGVTAGEALFVDDFQTNIEGARSAGLKVVHFTDADRAIEEIRMMI
jgi:epoxide hydrolase-like predicted phosphatase